MRAPCPRPGPAGAAARAARLLHVAVLALAASFSARPALAGWWDDAARARETTISELRAAPERWRDVPVAIRVTYSRDAGRVNPYFTQFVPERWRAIAVRPAGSPADAPEFERAFVRRGSRDDERLPSFRPGRGLLLRAVVRDTVGGEPWIEILGITVDGDPLTPEEDALRLQADRFLEAANPAAALDLYSGLLESRPLAPSDRATLLRGRAEALHRGGRLGDALAAARSALEIDPEHAATADRVRTLERLVAERGDVAVRREPAAPETATPPAAPPVLLLPVPRVGLAPPAGLPAGPAPAPAPGPEAGAGAGAGAAPLPLPVGSSPPPTPAPHPAVPPAPVTKGAEEAEEDVPPPPPPPVPRRSSLSGPR